MLFLSSSPGHFLLADMTSAVTRQQVVSRFGESAFSSLCAGLSFIRAASPPVILSSNVEQKWCPVAPAHTVRATRVHNTGTRMTLLLKPYSNVTLMCKEQWCPGAVVLTGKLTNDSAWADVHPWEFSFLSSLMDPEGLFLRVEQLQRSNFGSKIDADGDNDAVQQHCQGLGTGGGEEDVCPVHTSALALCFTVHAWLGSTLVGGFSSIHQFISRPVFLYVYFWLKPFKRPCCQQYMLAKKVQILQNRQFISRINLMFPPAGTEKNNYYYSSGTSSTRVHVDLVGWQSNLLRYTEHQHGC